MLLAMLLLCLNLLVVQGPVFGQDFTSRPDVPEKMDLQAARQYMLWLINRDRAAFGLTPVTLDEVATVAGQAHADEMAVSKYVSHWDLKGRKPYQRYSEAGGTGAVMENVLITHDFQEGQTYSIASNQLFRRDELEKMESLFFNERPPQDGHRKNILDPAHNKVGIGLTLAQPGNRVTCTQEFVNEYGSLSSLPEKGEKGAVISMNGKLQNGLTLHSIDIYREQLPSPMTREQLRATLSYTLPNDNVARLFPPPYRSPAALTLKRGADGESFSAEVKADQNWKPGLYYIIVWAKKADSVMPIVSASRTVSIN